MTNQQERRDDKDLISYSGDRSRETDSGVNDVDWGSHGTDPDESGTSTDWGSQGEDTDDIGDKAQSERTGTNLGGNESATQKP